MGKIVNRKVIILNEYKELPEVRYCSKCQKTKLVNQFHKGAHYCKPCKKIYRHESYLLNKKLERKQMKKWSKAHPDYDFHYKHVHYGYKDRLRKCKLCA